MKDESVITLVSMTLIAFLLTVALYLGYDNLTLAAGVALISGLGGYEVRKRQEENQKGQDETAEIH